MFAVNMSRLSTLS